MEKLIKVFSYTLICILLFSVSNVYAQTKNIDKEANKSDKQTEETKKEESKKTLTIYYPVKLGNKVLFKISSGIGSVSAEERVSAIENNLTKLAENPLFKPESITIREYDSSTLLVASNKTIMAIISKDVVDTKKSTKEYAQELREKIIKAIVEYREEYNTKSISFGVVKALLLSIFLLLIIKFFDDLIKLTFSLADRMHRNNSIPPLKFQKSVIISSKQIIALFKIISRLLEVIAILFLFYAYLAIIFSFFPWTQDKASLLYLYVVNILDYIIKSIVQYLPNIVFIFIVILLAYLMTRVIKFIFSEIKSGTIEFKWFYKEWSDITYNILKFLVIASVIAIIYPLLPGANSDSFKGLSIILGILISLGSGPTVSTVISSIVLTYTRAFDTGDWIQIGSVYGQVVEQTAFVTRIKTLKNEIISIPNSKILSSEITNFSTLASQEGILVHTEVTIGYDAPWQTVHGLLINAALETENILKDKQPFVLQKDLGDFSIRYEINAFTDKPEFMVKTSSYLLENIQNKFNEAGVEIMSPNFFALRDGNKSTVPEQYHPTGYEAPSFRVDIHN